MIGPRFHNQAEWWYSLEGEQVGPVTSAELARYRGKIQKMLDDLARQDARRAGVSDARVFDLVNDSL